MEHYHLIAERIAIENDNRCSEQGINAVDIKRIADASSGNGDIGLTDCHVAPSTLEPEHG